MIARYITEADLDLYQRLGWRCSYYGERGDHGACFVASWLCCK